MINRTIGLVALDDRPCNYLWPQKLIRGTGFKVIAPPRDIMGFFYKPGDRDSIYSWLRENVKKMDVLILSLDMMTYGGLIASRKFGEKINNLKKRLKIIEELKVINPRLTVYAFSVLMRISINVDSPESQKHWKNIFEYSKTHYQITQLKRTALKKELKELEKLIPERILKEYLSTRKRNFTLNTYFLDFVDKGFIDFLVYSQEDAAEYGLHREEQTKLKKIIRKRDLLEKVDILTGTDELFSLLLARYINHLTEIVPKFFVDYTYDEGRYVIAPYEDCCLDISVGEHIRVLGGIQTVEPDNSEIIYLCHNSNTVPIDLFSVIPQVFDKSPAQIFMRKIRKYLKFKKPLAIADVFYSNGGDPELVSRLISNGYLKYISSYSALNTTSNTIGLSLSLANIDFVMGFPEKHKKELILERIIDDCYYQTLLRPEMNRIIRERGFSWLNLDGNGKLFEEDLNKKLQEYLYPVLKKWKLSIEKFSARFPWDRTFEIEIDLKLK